MSTTTTTKTNNKTTFTTFVINTIILDTIVFGWFSFITFITSKIKSNNDIIIPPIQALQKSIRKRKLMGGMVGETNVFDMPEQIVTKSSRNDANARFNVFYSDTYREVKYYLEPSLQHPSIQIPNLIYGDYSRVWGTMNLSIGWVHNSEKLGPYLGNQDNSMLSPPVEFTSLRFHKLPITDILKPIFISQGEFHASYFNHGELLSQHWLKGAAWYQGKRQHVWTRAVDAVKRYWTSAKASRGGKLLSKELMSYMDSIIDNSTWNNFQSYIKTSNFTLTLGDFHAGNILVIPNPTNTTEPKFVYLDFSEVGIGDGLTDLAQMMISDLNPDVVRVHMKEFIRAYYGAFTKSLGGKDNVPTNYTEDYVLRNVLKGGVEKWTCLLGLISGIPQFPDSGVRYFARNLEAWIKLTQEYFSKEDMMQTFSIKSLVVIR
jgi:hypothetical protein